MRGDCDALLTDIAAPGRADALAQALRGWDANDPLALLALHILRAGDEEQRMQRAAALVRHPDVASLLLPLLREDLRALLACDSRIVVADADLQPPRNLAPIPTLARRRRR